MGHFKLNLEVQYINKYGMATRTRLCTQISEKLAQYRWDIWYVQLNEKSIKY